MSSKELPPPPGAEQSSVFSVFGFRSNHPVDDALERPLDLPPSQGDSQQGMLGQSVLDDLKHLRQKQMRELEDQRVVQIPPEPARKLQEQSRVTAQAIFNPADKVTAVQQQPGKASSTLQNFTRRYSRPQVSTIPNEEDDTFDADRLLQKFNTSLNYPGYTAASSSSSSSSQPRAIGDICNTNLNNSDVASDPDPHVLHRYFGRRRRSSPDVATLSRLRGNNLQLTSQITSQQPLAERPASTEGQDQAAQGQLAVKKGMDKSASYSNLQSAAVTKSTGASLAAGKDSVDAPIMTDTVSSSGVSGLGILSKTRKFGAWLTKATEGEKVEVTKKDLNAFAPTSF